MNAITLPEGGVCGESDDTCDDKSHIIKLVSGTIRCQGLLTRQLMSSIRLFFDPARL